MHRNLFISKIFQINRIQSIVIFRREVAPLYETMLVGPLVRWSVGLLVRWSVGPLVRWSVGPLVRWFVRPLVHWSVGPSVGWSPYHFENRLRRDCFEKRRKKRKSADVKNWLRRNCFAPGNGCPFLFS
jgi:hypothetical protein